MSIDYDKALALDIALIAQTYTQRDTLLYALGLGLGANPMDERELRFVFEDALAVFPTMPVVQAFVPLRRISLGIDYSKNGSW